MDIVFDGISGFFSLQAWAGTFSTVYGYLDVLRPYSTVLSLLLLTGIVYCFFRIEQIHEATRHHDEEHGHAHGEETETVVPQTITNKRWQRILDHINSGKESDWRLAVLEADILLDELVTNMGYRGDSLGEKLKGVEKSDFTTLDSAWEAHAVRNKIAHEGSSFALVEREAKRVIGLYEEVFKEFHYI